MDFTVQLILTLISLMGLFITIIGFPGLFLILLSLLIYGVYVDFTTPDMWVYVVFSVIVILSSFADNIAILLGAKSFGSSKYGMIGAFVGGIVGFLMLPPVGVFVGPFIGALIVEVAVKKDLKKALKSALGTFIGYITGVILKFIIALILFGWLMTIVW